MGARYFTPKRSSIFRAKSTEELKKIYEIKKVFGGSRVKYDSSALSVAAKGNSSRTCGEILERWQVTGEGKYKMFVFAKLRGQIGILNFEERI